jgi:hypothetical protein
MAKNVVYCLMLCSSYDGIVQPWHSLLACIAWVQAYMLPHPTAKEGPAVCKKDIRGRRDAHAVAEQMAPARQRQ